MSAIIRRWAGVDACPGCNSGQIAFVRSGPTVRWDLGYASLLELAEACGVPVRWARRTGVCHTCETAVISGTVSYTPDG